MSGVRPAGSARERVVEVGGLPFVHDDRVLEPRPWTAAQARWAADLAAGLPAGPILELCSGAGHIGLLAARWSGRSLVCVDVSPAACQWTRHNADALGLADRVEVRRADLEAALDADERMPLILADPPWVTTAETGRHPADPVLAIDGGADGLDLARRCLAVADRHLLEDGLLVLQLGDVAQVGVLEAHAVMHHALGLRSMRQEERGVLALWGRPAS